MMENRLALGRKLMPDDSALFVSIDDNEYARLKELADSLYGEHNFITTVIWQKVYAPKNTARHFSEDHDFIVVYAKDAEVWTPFLLPRTDEADARYINPDDDPRGPWKPDNLLARNPYSKNPVKVKRQILGS